MAKYPELKLENQLCFPLYAASKEMVRRYTTYLDPLGLTYTQYIVMLVLWEEQVIKVSDLGKRLFLDSGTLTPVLKKLETKGLLERHRCPEDERCVACQLTESGKELAGQAAELPVQVGGCLALTQEEKQQMYTLLYRVLEELGK